MGSKLRNKTVINLYSNSGIQSVHGTVNGTLINSTASAKSTKAKCRSDGLVAPSCQVPPECPQPFSQTRQPYRVRSASGKPIATIPARQVRPELSPIHRARSSPSLTKSQKDVDGRTDQEVVFINNGDDNIDYLSSAGDVATNCIPPGVELSPEVILKYSGEKKYNQVYDINLRAIHLKSIQHLDKFNNVRILDLSGNQIKHIDGLHFNKELRDLKLYDNQIAEISNLDRLKDLQHLHLQHNQIRSIGKGLQSQSKLKVLRLDFNQIDRLAPNQLLGCMQLATLDMSSNRLNSVAALNCLPNLEELFVRNNRLNVIGNLSKCRKLQEVDVSLNPLTDLSGLQSLPALKVLNVSHCPLTNFQTLRHLSSLEELYASHCHLMELQDVVEFYPNLQVLDVSHNQLEAIKNLECLRSLADLVELSLTGNPLCSECDNVSSLAQRIHQLLPKIETLDGKPISEVISGVQKSTQGLETPRGNLTARSQVLLALGERPVTPLASNGRPMTPLVRPMTPASQLLMTTSYANSDELVKQLSTMEEQLSSLHTEFSAKFDTLRASFAVLPSERPLSARSRPASRAGVKSRLQEAQLFASQNFDSDSVHV